MIEAEQQRLPFGLLSELSEEALAKALRELRDMQSREGAVLREDLVCRSRRLRQTAAGIRAQADLVVASYRDRLRERIRALGVEVELDDEKLAKDHSRAKKGWLLSLALCVAFAIAAWLVK